MSRGFHPFGGRVSRRFGDTLSPEDAYLSYYDVRLTKEDVDCIKDDWLTDNAIAFWEEYLEHETLRAYPGSHVVLLRPSMSFMLVQTPDPTTLREALPSFEHTTHIFLPINDCDSPNLAEGGSHWTLLLVSIIDGVAFHYDSLTPSNRSVAAKTTSKLSILLGRALRFVDLDTAPQQENSSDCGVYVCLVMRLLLEGRLLRNGENDKVDMTTRGVVVDAQRGRKEMLKVIEEIRRQAVRSQSRSRSKSPLGHGKEGSRSPSVPRVGD